jgi:hypothetical protein
MPPELNKEGDMAIKQSTIDYSGTKVHSLKTADRWEDADWLSSDIRTTADFLPTPKHKKPKASKSQT